MLASDSGHITAKETVMLTKWRGLYAVYFPTTKNSCIGKELCCHVIVESKVYTAAYKILQ